MRRNTRLASWTAFALALVAGPIAGDALASGVGASIYVQAPQRSPVQQASCETGACGPGGDCQRLGFAGVDGATVPPCTAEGGCYPKRNTFGYYQTRWRTWPGAKYGGPSPAVAEPTDEIPAIDPPSAEEEDKQAPPPIEDSESSSDEGDAGGEAPGVEINLPPLPDGPLPTTPRPPRPQGGPPALPFGFAPPTNSPSPSRSDWRPTPTPVSAVPAKLPKPAATGDDAPPPLPFGFTSAAPQQLLRRLPNSRPAGRYDEAVRQVSAESPAR